MILRKQALLASIRAYDGPTGDKDHLIMQDPSLLLTPKSTDATISAQGLQNRDWRKTERKMPKGEQRNYGRKQEEEAAG